MLFLTWWGFVNKRTFNTDALLSSAAGMVNLPRQQEKCGCKGEWERDAEPEREREREPTGLCCTCPRIKTLPSFHLLFWPQGPQGPARLEQMQNFQHKSLNPNAQMHTHIFPSLQLSFFPHSFSCTIAYLPIPREMHESEEGVPRSTDKLSSSVCVFPEMWRGWSPLLHAPFIYLYIYIKDIWILTLLFALTLSAFFIITIFTVNTTSAVRWYWNPGMSFLTLFGVSREGVEVLQVIIFLQREGFLFCCGLQKGLYCLLVW